MKEVVGAINKLLSLVGDDLEKSMLLLLGDEQRDLVLSQLPDKVMRHIMDAGGKKLRPLLTIAIAHSLGYKGDDHLYYAAAVEAIPTATLLHDDVIDGSDTRRSKYTANYLWGNKASVLVGDYLFSRAFILMTERNNPNALKVLSAASSVIVEAELWQLELLGQDDLSYEQYLKLITNKTARLFSAACEVGVLVGQSSDNCDQDKVYIQRSMSDFGLALGRAFQILDDYLDYFGDAEKLGKPLFQDFQEGKMTLPLIMAMQKSTEDERNLIKKDFGCKNLDTKKLDMLREIMLRYNVDQAVIREAEHYCDSAIELVDVLPINQYSSIIKELTTELLLRRG